jgi:protein-S-isoprenylcysteine O-methyltransferase Ste14
MILAEVFIYFYTTNKNKSNEKINKTDKGSKWLLMINFYVCIYISFFMVSVSVAEKIRNLVLPNIFSYIGVVLMLIGIVIRLAAVLTLKRAFTLSVQTANTQHLITNGIYHKVRNPAYTGSICSLIGTSVGLRNVIAILVVFILSMICYMIRINIEEKALRMHFGEEFIDYKRHTYHLIPYIW